MRSPTAAQLGFFMVRGNDKRTLRFVPLIDERIKLLQHPIGPLLAAQVIKVQQINGREPLE